MEASVELEKVAKSKVDSETRVCRRIEIGNCVHQGDIYIFRVSDNHPKGKKLGTRKLAIGQGEGSNHMAVGDDLEVYEGKKLPDCVNFNNDNFNREALGPVVVAKKQWTNDHTTHAKHILPAGTYQVTYQIDMATKHRVVD